MPPARPRLRRRCIGDAGAALEDPGPTAVTPAKRPATPWIVAAMLAAFATAACWYGWRASRPVEHPLTRPDVDLGPQAITGFDVTATLSPDGRRLVFPVRTPNGRQLLATRLLDQARTTLLDGTEDGFNPFFSPDGRWIGFFSSGQLKKTSAEGGGSAMLCPAAIPRGGSWGEDGNLVVALTQLSALARVPSAGGTPQLITRLAAGELTHRWPQVLPGGEAILFTGSPTNVGLDNANIEVASLKSGQVKVLMRGGYFGRYVPGGYLVYVHQGALLGVKFDLARLEVHGSPIPLVDDVAANPITGGGQFSFSTAADDHGTLVYVAGKSAAQSWGINWLDSSGKTEPLLATPGIYTNLRLSPDGRKLAFFNGSNILVHDLERDTTTPLTYSGNVRTPVWTPDGKRIAFGSSDGGSSIFWARGNGSGEPELLLRSKNNLIPWSFSPDGRHLAYYEIGPETGYDLWTLPLDVSDPDHPKARKPELFLRTPADEGMPQFSPDGRWIAYRSNESGRNEIYVRPFPGGSGGKWPVSNGGAMYPFWSKGRHEMFYKTEDYRIMVVDYTVEGDAFVPGKPRIWSEKRLFYPGISNLDLAPDDRRFAVLAMPESVPGHEGSVHVTFLMNFFDELRRKVR